jgi:hypothetical protein
VASFRSNFFVSEVSPTNKVSGEGRVSVVVNNVSGSGANNFDITGVIVSGSNSRSNTFDEGNPRPVDTDRGKGVGNNVGNISVSKVDCLTTHHIQH